MGIFSRQKSNVSVGPPGHQQKVDALAAYLKYSRGRVTTLAKLEQKTTKHLLDLNKREETAKAKGDKEVERLQALEEKAEAKQDKHATKIAQIEKAKQKIVDQEANVLTKQENVVAKAEEKAKAAEAKVAASGATEGNYKKIDTLRDAQAKEERYVTEQKEIHANLPEKHRLDILKLDMEKDATTAQLEHDLKKLKLAKTQAMYNRDFLIHSLLADKAKTTHKKAQVEARLAEERDRCDSLEREFTQLSDVPPPVAVAPYEPAKQVEPVEQQPETHHEPEHDDAGSFNDDLDDHHDTAHHDDAAHHAEHDEHHDHYDHAEHTDYNEHEHTDYNEHEHTETALPEAPHNP
ncbi:hypothetical protein SARC_04053 [Sphaeroforma arctica JP610]|uniref:Uncharacterized protein n=1 Tax=Sphaeroforma arctica JP610 TaxID=667725 RepID=A0A0L0G497_9EUKA|nr:hypothetical protein SARC_04053 [Sphaeroforma arctica JP610]KNC83694.1 hypothetical protein SARC_04053 [Sphaeroforma arctica JP610]|eukprot:XP_014157596.1 hypothetical protein SARC_04053 [Sphaeroforma arctica JP610]